MLDIYRKSDFIYISICAASLQSKIRKTIFYFKALK